MWMPDENKLFQDVALLINDFKKSDFLKSIESSQNLYFNDKFDQIEGWYTLSQNKNRAGKHQLKSELIEIKQSNERYLVVYQSEVKQKTDNQDIGKKEDNNYKGRNFTDEYDASNDSSDYINGDSRNEDDQEQDDDDEENYTQITICYIFKFNQEFQLVRKFLADINTNDEYIRIFNRVSINQNGIYYLEKNQLSDENNSNVNNQIVVNQIEFEAKDKYITGFEELKVKNIEKQIQK